MATLCNCSADSAKTDNADGLALETNAFLTNAPLTAPDIADVIVHIARSGNHHAYDVVCNGFAVAARSVAYVDTVSSGSNNVNAVEADCGA